MGLLNNIFRRKTAKEAVDSGVAFSDPTLADLFQRPYAALENSAFWSCVINLCRLYGTLPLHLYDSRKSVSRTSPLARLLKEPNPYMSSYQFKFVMGFNFEMYGVAYAIIGFSSAGDPMSLYPVSPSLMIPRWKDGKLYYSYAPTNEQIPAEHVLVLNNTPVGYTSVLSPVAYSEGDVRMAKESQKLQTKYFANASQIGGILYVPDDAPKEVFDKAKALMQSYEGGSKAYSAMTLRTSFKYQPISLSESDTTKLEKAQNWTVSEICRRFQVPPFLCGDTTHTTYASTEQQGINFVVYCIGPRTQSWEEAINDRLCADGQYVKFNLAGLMRGDHAARAAFYHNAIMDGWLSINEVRALEDMEPIRDGEKHFFPLNYTTLDKVGMSTAAGYENTQKRETAGPEKEEPTLAEKQALDEAYVVEIRKVGKSEKAKLEAIIRSQLKAEITALKELAKSGAAVEDIYTTFEDKCKEIAKDYSARYVTLFTAMFANMIPVIRKKAGTDDSIEVNTDDFAAKYGDTLANRHAGERVSYVKGKLNPDTVEDDVEEVCDHWAETVPDSEAREEMNRATNAASVVIFRDLGLEFMHVVSAPDCCEICQRYADKVCSVNGTIIKKGDTATDDAGNVIKINRNYKHPPFHRGCSCTVAPGR